MIVRINIRQPYLRQQLKVEFVIASLAENFPFTMSLFGHNCLVFIQTRLTKNTPLERIRKLANHFYTEKKYLNQIEFVQTLWTPQPPPQALRFSHGRGERETRVTGDEPQGTMGRVQTPSQLPLRAHRKRDVWVRGRWAPYLLIMATTTPPITIIVHCNTSVKKTAVRPPTKKCLSYLQAWEVLTSRSCPCRYTTISRKVVGKSARDNPERYCGWL